MFRDLSGADVPDQAARGAMDTDVDHDGTSFHVLGAQELLNAGRGDHDVGSRGGRSEIAGPGVRLSYRRVSMEDS
jgi:hypothetical protein